MVFLKKVKALKNVITGGAAKVSVECENFSLDSPFEVIVKVQTLDAPVKIRKAYLDVVGREELSVGDIDIVSDGEGGLDSRLETITGEFDSVALKFTLAEAHELEADKLYEWSVEVKLPEDAQPVFKGHYCQHTYLAFAGLDCFGNDPDSGWVEIN